VYMDASESMEMGLGAGSSQTEGRVETDRGQTEGRVETDRGQTEGRVETDRGQTEGRVETDRDSLRVVSIAPSNPLVLWSDSSDYTIPSTLIHIGAGLME
jgi:hypothetical protein